MHAFQGLFRARLKLATGIRELHIQGKHHQKDGMEPSFSTTLRNYICFDPKEKCYPFLDKCKYKHFFGFSLSTVYIYCACYFIVGE